MAAQLARARVLAILEHWEKELHEIFKCYAAADMEGDALSTTDSVNLAELMFMVKEGKLLDDRLSGAKVQQIFTQVNAAEAEEEEGDDDESELVYDEWALCVARICDAKIPEEARGGNPFEYTLQAWLDLVFVPTYKQLLKDKRKGTASRTL